MSTTFGVFIGEGEVDYEDGLLNPEQFDWEDVEYYFIKVARQANGGAVYWTNDLAPLLPPDLKVYALDNTAQGIYTIGDIRDYIQSGGDN
jgi:hypothetical protein